MRFKKTLCIAIIAIFMLSLVSCGSGGKALFSFRGTELTDNMYSYMMSSQKAYLRQLYEYYNAYASMYGQTSSTASFDDYLRSELTDENGNKITVAKRTNDMIVESAKDMVIINHFFNKYGLSVTDESDVADINSVLEEEIQEAGNMEYLNILLSQFGADYDIAREYLYNNYNATVLYDYLYGDQGIQRLDDSAVKQAFERDYNKIDVLYFAYYDTDKESGDKVIKTVDTVTTEQINEGIANQFVKIRYILFYTIDRNTQNMLPDDKIAEKESLANDLFASIKNGSASFDDVQSEKNEGSNDPVILSRDQTDERVKAVEEAAFDMNVGDYSLVKCDIGYYIITREMMGESDVTSEMKTLINEKLAKAAIKEYAEKAYENVLSGMLSFDKYEDPENKPDPYGAYTHSIVFCEEEMDEEINSKVAEMNVNDYAVVDLASGCCVIRKMSFDEDDYKERYDEVYEEISQKEFNDFIKGFYSEVIVNEAELAKFDFLTALELELVPLDDTSGS